MSERRLLIFLCIICPFILHFGLSFGVLSVILLWATFTASVLAFTTIISRKTAGATQQKYAVVTHSSAKRAKRDSGPGDNGDRTAGAECRKATGPGTGRRSPFKNYVSQPVISPIISPISPPHKTSLRRESEYFQGSGHATAESGWKSKHFEPVILSKSPDHHHRNQDLYVSRGLYSSPGYSFSEKISPRQVSNINTSFGRSPLSKSVRSPLISPSKNHFINSSPQPFKPIHKMSYPLDHDSSIPLPLTNRHYPTHQPQYTRTSMGLLPASSIFYGDGAGLSFSPLRKGGGVRTHSPVTVKIARPDNRRSASPLFRRLSLERNSGSPNPLHRDAVIAALNEKRKRIQTEEPDDASSVASSAGVIAKRRRLENGSRSSTPSVADSSNYSMINGYPQSDSSPEGSTKAKRASHWSGMRGVQSHTPRNAIDSSISSSRRASMANMMMRKRVMSQPPMPEDSPTKKPWQPPGSPQRGEAGSREDVLQSSPQVRLTAARLTEKIGKPDSEMQEVTDDPKVSKDAMPSEVRAKSLLTSRLKTPKLDKQRHHTLKKSGSPGEYTAADLQEDRHFAKQRVNYILGSLQEDEEKDKPQNEPEVTTTSLGSANPVISTGTAAPSSLSSTEMLKLSTMKTLPVSSLSKDGLQLPSLNSNNSGTIGSGKQAQLQSTVAGKQPSSAPLGVSKTSLGGSFLTAGLEKPTGIIPSSSTSSSVLGVTVTDKAKPSSGINPAASSIQTPVGQSLASVAPKKDSVLKGLLAGTDLAATASPLQLGGATSSSAFGQLAGKLTTTSQAGHGVNPLSKPVGSGILTQGTPTSGLTGFLSQPQTSTITSSQGSLQPASTASGQLQNSSISSSLYSQVVPSSSVTQTTTPVGTQAISSSGFQFGASVGKPPAATSNPMSGSLFVSSAQAAPSNTQSTFQFGGTTSQVPQSSAPSTTGFQFSSTKATTASTLGTAGLSFGGVPTAAPSTQSSIAQPSTPFQFGGATPSTSNTGTPVFSLGGSAGTLAGQTTQMSSGFLSTPSVAGSSMFGAANPAAATKPSFTQGFGQSVNPKPAQPSASTFGNQGIGMGGAGGPQFKPAFGAATQQSQQPSQPSFQFGGSPAVSATQPAAAGSGGFTFNAKPAASTGSVFGTGAAPAAGASPFQTGAASTTAGMFGQQSSQPPSFGSTSQPTNTFGGTAPGQSMFGSQSSTPAPSAGGFNFGASNPSQASQSSGFAFGAAAAAAATQPPAASQPATGGLFQFGQAGQQASQPMGSVGGFASPSRPTSFNFGAGGGGAGGAGFGTPAPSGAPAFGAVTPTNPGGFNLGSSASASTQRRTSRLTRQNRQRTGRR